MICFLINYYNEPSDQVQKLINDVRLVYGSDCQILMAGDGGQESRSFTGHDADLMFNHLKTRENGGAWTHRYLKHFLENSNCDFLIKLDPDTSVISRVLKLPESDCIFCAVNEVTMGDFTFRIPAGGALGLTRKMAESIVSRELFLGIHYRDNIQFGNYNDLMLMDIAWRENLPLIDRPDFCCGNRPKHDFAAFYHK